tara:strand:- start:5 stop:739 length:735 start_codon:yes stop_codon:yes gene_type:complete
MSKPYLERSSGRLFNEARPCKITWDPMEFALSSLIIHTGKTSVLCSLSQEDRVPAWRKDQGKGWLSAEYRLLPGSTPQRQKRELLKLSGRTQEIQRLIGRSLRAAIDMEGLGERTLLIDCDVIQADAGTRTASITGAWIALHKGLERLVKVGELNKNPLKTQVAAISVGLVKGFCLLDLDYSEDSIADVDLNVVMDSDGKFLEIQGSAEQAAFSRNELNDLLDLSEEGLVRLHSAQREALNNQG